MVKQTARDW